MVPEDRALVCLELTIYLEMLKQFLEIEEVFLKMLNIELPCDLAIPLLSIYSKELKTGTCNSYYTPMCIAALFTIAERYCRNNPMSISR